VSDQVESVAVIGCGKLGLPLAAVVAEHFPTVAVDLDEGLIARLQGGEIPFEEPGLRERLESVSLEFTVDFERAADADITFVIVPTPSENGIFTSKYVLDAIERFGRFLRHKPGRHTVVVVSTVMPGETSGPIRRVLEGVSNRKIGHRLGLVYSPEFIALGDVIAGLERPDMVLIGESDERSGEIALQVLSRVVKNDAPVARLSVLDAEITKIAINTYLSIKVGFANNLGEICERMFGADAVAISAAVGLDSRINRKYLKPAVAVAGPCLPRDLVAFSTMAKHLGVTADLADAASAINDRQCERIVTRVLGLSGPGDVIGVLGLSYKPGTYVTDTSPGIAVVEALLNEGAIVIGYDPMAKPDGMALAESAQGLVDAASVIVVMTPWPQFRDLRFDIQKTVLDCWDHITADQVVGELVRCGVGM
jgi:UDPglucose 6-dehydrogenase